MFNKIIEQFGPASLYEATRESNGSNDIIILKCEGFFDMPDTEENRDLVMASRKCDTVLCTECNTRYGNAMTNLDLYESDDVPKSFKHLHVKYESDIFSNVFMTCLFVFKNAIVTISATNYDDMRIDFFTTWLRTHTCECGETIHIFDQTYDEDGKYSFHMTGYMNHEELNFIIDMLNEVKIDADDLIDEDD